MRIVFFINSRTFSPSKVSHYTVVAATSPKKNKISSSNAVVCVNWSSLQTLNVWSCLMADCDNYHIATFLIWAHHGFLTFPSNHFEPNTEGHMLCTLHLASGCHFTCQWNRPLPKIVNTSCCVLNKSKQWAYSHLEKVYLATINANCVGLMVSAYTLQRR